MELAERSADIDRVQSELGKFMLEARQSARACLSESRREVPQLGQQPFIQPSR